MATRAQLNEQWKNEYLNKLGGPWLGRAEMDRLKAERVTNIEHALRVIHASAGHGPFVINDLEGRGPVNTTNQKLSDAYAEIPRVRTCFCGLTDDSDAHVELTVLDQTTYDGFQRSLREVRWPGFVWEGPEFPEQPRDTDARRGRVFLVHGDDVDELSSP